MHQYDVFENPSSRTRKQMPYLLVLQSDLVSETEAVIVAPLTTSVEQKGSRLYPEFAIRNEKYTMLTPDLASVPRRALTQPVTNLAPEWSRITAALDILFTGV